MRFIVLGGAGDMGSQAVEDLAVTPGVAQVTIADRDYARAEQVVRRLSAAPALVDVVELDADDHDGLVAAMRGYDVAASALGPFYRYEAPLAQAAIEAGVDYASICDDWSAVDAVLALDDQARAAGRTVITGLGASPGLSNLAVALLAEEMDTIRQADIYVYMPLDAGEGQAVLRHMLYMLSGQVPVHRQGERCMVPACSLVRTVQFPSFGEVRVWNVGHTEPVTLPRTFPGLQTVNIMLGMGPGTGAFVSLARLGLFGGPEKIERWARRLGPLTHLGARQELPPPGAIRIDVVGERQGLVVHRLLCGVDRMRPATGLSLSVGALMLARGELTAPQGGVYPPEACLAPRPFVASMADRGLRVYRDLAMTRLLD
jgi:saccharopine dehydrogenase-like NADP-dependent oxidoreductase